ncbi:hypothetical protein KI387_010528, partial [Taxus chinensis]
HSHDDPINGRDNAARGLRHSDQSRELFDPSWQACTKAANASLSRYGKSYNQSSTR